MSLAVMWFFSCFGFLYDGNYADQMIYCSLKKIDTRVK